MINLISEYYWQLVFFLHGEKFACTLVHKKEKQNKTKQTKTKYSFVFKLIEELSSHHILQFVTNIIFICATESKDMFVFIFCCNDKQVLELKLIGLEPLKQLEMIDKTKLNTKKS